MNRNYIDSIILGDNQFFGVNHLSEEKGMQTREKFKDISEIRRILYSAMDHGVKGVFFSTHPDIYQITEMMRNDSAIKNHFNIYVNVPYIVKYISMVNTMGPVGTVQTMLGGNEAGKSLKLIAAGTKNLLTMDYLNLVNRLVDVEILPFHDLNVKAVLLHNSLCDLALGYQLGNIIKSFDGYVKNKLKLIPGYGTQNYPAFAKFLLKSGIEQSFVMTAINKIGFYMNPGTDAYEEYLKNDNNCVLAMATLASGRLTPDEAYEYLGRIGIRNVVVGLSSEKHANETFSAIRKNILGE